jgi:ABC-type branched-subunit amino acid transport system substrate-binding protein
VQAEFTTPTFVGSPGSTFAAAADKDAIENYAISITTRAVDDPNDPQTKAFRELYEAKYGSAPGAGSFWALSYFDAVQMLARSMALSGSVEDLAAIGTAMHSAEAEDYPARTLDLSFTDTNDASYTPQMGYRESGETTYVDLPLG